MNFAQVSDSFFKLAANVSGVSNDGTRASASNSAVNAGARMARRISSAKRFTIFADVPTGANMLKEDTASIFANPASANEGVVGSSGVLCVVASVRTLPA